MEKNTCFVDGSGRLQGSVFIYVPLPLPTAFQGPSQGAFLKPVCRWVLLRVRGYAMQHPGKPEDAAANVQLTCDSVARNGALLTGG